ncbi:hypothetical protein PSEUBRA_002950 [Kalmanozyma brasiliensis GHG001]|uniref:uncharacterized protein n=1 Tax=Kalmanozyma brasiliensis (strain GHG001) TaxID=1365824 RepID=UPI0028680531|nr:uncharacterized protein PSEUBRA_002950 [Kalmanozyma brasiliensis GHG001]KAF6767158.1 hypothetical protein PSEUBRA_002950 [Kalmanozyma brasiliensis GHG001]
MDGFDSAANFEFLVNQLVNPIEALSCYDSSVSAASRAGYVTLALTGFVRQPTPLRDDTPDHVIDQLVDELQQGMRRIVAKQAEQVSTAIEAQLCQFISAAIESFRPANNPPRLELCGSPENILSCSDPCLQSHHCCYCSSHVPHEYMYRTCCVWCKVRLHFLIPTSENVLVQLDKKRGRPEEWDEDDLAVKDFKLELPLLWRRETTEADVRQVFAGLGLDVTAVSRCSAIARPERKRVQARYVEDAMSKPTTSGSLPAFIKQLLPNDFIESLVSMAPADRVEVLLRVSLGSCCLEGPCHQVAGQRRPELAPDWDRPNVPKFFNVAKGPHSPLRPFLVMSGALIRHDISDEHADLRKALAADLGALRSALQPVEKFFATGQSSGPATGRMVQRILDASYGEGFLKALESVRKTLLKDVACT